MQRGEVSPNQYLLHGSLDLLNALKSRGMQLYLASGTDEVYVKREAKLLGVAEYFGEHIHGALDDYKNFSKRQVIDRILKKNLVSGEQLLIFGDGYVEIEDCKNVGGLAVAVASDEANNGSGEFDEWKRNRLLGVGADIVIPDYRDAELLLNVIEGKMIGKKLDIRKIKPLPLSERKSFFGVGDVMVPVDHEPPPIDDRLHQQIEECAERIREARARGASVMLIYGAHLIKNGAAFLLDDLLANDQLTHLATNGAGTIHDWEYSWLGRSSECVRSNVATGTFGTWEETGRNIHLALLAGGIEGRVMERRLGA